MSSKTIINLFSLLIIVFNSCKKANPNFPEIYVPAYLKAMVPYTDGQSVSFSNGTGQVVNATVSITSTFVYTPVCSSCGSPYNGENISYTLNAGSNKFMEFTVKPYSYIQFTIYSPHNNYQPAGAFNFSVESGVSQGSCFAQGQTCLSSIILNGKTFTNVLEIAKQAPAGSPYIVKVYHTVSQGIVGFAYGNGTTFALN